MSKMIRLHNKGANSRGRRRGAVVHIVAGAMVALLAFAALAVDFGVLRYDENHLQRIADASALAGATKLKTTGNDADDKRSATTLAIMIARQNGGTITASDISFNAESDEITVKPSRNRSLFFARVFNVSNKLVSKKATATAIGARLTPGVVPIGITTGTYNTYAPGGIPIAGTGNRATINLIDHKKVDFRSGNFVLFDLRSVDNNAKSPEHMKRQLDGSEEIPVRAGELGGTVDALNADSQENFMVTGMTSRFAYAAGSPWFDPSPALGPAGSYVGTHYDAAYNNTEVTNPDSSPPFTHNPRIMSLIVTSEMDAKGGNTDSPILDFAPVYVESMTVVNDEVKLTVRFLPRTSDPSAGEKPRLID